MEDRISELPDDVLRKILHLLPLQDAIGTSILSKRWRRIDICSTFLGLNFMLHRPWIYTKSNRRKLRRSLYMLDKLLRRQCGSNVNIQKFEVMISIRNFGWIHPRDKYTVSADELISIPLQREVDRWMSALAKPGLSVLDLTIALYHEDYYTIPLSRLPLSTLAAAKSLKTLSLSGFKICCSSSERVEVSLPCLELLSLENTSLKRFVMEELLKGSPLLENLQIINCHGLEILTVEGLSQLKTLRVMYDHDGLPQKIVIDAPCLRVLEIDGVSPEVTTLSTCPQFLQQIKCRLYYHSWFSYFLEGTQLPIMEWFCRLVDKCRFLEHMTMSITGIRTPAPEKIHISSTLHALKTLNLSTWNLSDGNLVSFEIVAPNLEKFYMVSKSNLPFIRLNASEQLEVELDMSNSSPGDEWYTRWAKFLSYFNQSRVLKIQAHQGELFSIPKESRKDLPRPLFGVKCLELRIYRENPRPRTISDHIDYMLWLSPRPTNLTLESSTGTEVVIKCLYDDTKVVGDNKDKCCKDCNLLEVNCWRHSLNQVIIEKFEEDEMEKQNIKSFFQEQVNNLDYVEPVSDVNCLEDGLYEYYDRIFGHRYKDFICN